MTKKIASLELNYILKELQTLVNARLEKIILVGNKTLFLVFHKPNEGKIKVKVTIGTSICLSEEDVVGVNAGFGLMLKKYLTQARIREIKQLESERIVEFKFEKNGFIRLIIEFFGKGNIILADEKIIGVLEEQKWKDRELKAGIPYIYPKKEFNFFKDELTATDKDSIVTMLAIDFGLGGIYAEEACLVAGIDKKTKPKDADLKKLNKAVKELLNRKLKPNVVLKNSKVIDAVPFELKLYENLEKKYFDSYSKALEFYCQNEEKISEKNEKLLRIIEKQKETIEVLKNGEIASRKLGDMIFENYKLIDGIKTEINKAREKYEWKEIIKRLKGHKIIKEVNAKEKYVVIEIS